MKFEIDYLAISPEIILAAGLLLVLAVDVTVTRSRKWLAAVAAIGVVTLAILPLAWMFLTDEAPRVMFGGAYVVDDFALLLKGLFLAAGYIVLLMSVSYIEGERYYQGEYYFLLLASILGSVVMSSSRDLIVLFVGLELTTAPLFLLAGWRKGDARSNEAALKYFVLGVLSTAILLFGMSFLYGLTGAIDFAGIRAAAPGLVEEPAFIMAILFIVIGFGFKVSAVPFHFWAPDTYEGAPTPVTAYLSVSSKAAGFVGMLVVTYQAFPAAADIWGPAIWILAALSMTVGNLTALRQENIVRLLAYSSVAQAGFILVPFAVAGVSTDPNALGDSFAATVTYVAIYAFMNLGAFGVVIAASRRTGTGQIDGWAGLGPAAPGLGLLGAAFFFSLAGIPPLAGWFAKFVMFRAAIGGGNVWTTILAAIAAVNAVIALYYYARVAKVMWFDDPPVPLDEAAVARPIVPSLRVAMILAAVFVVVAGFYPPIAANFGEATRILAGG